jgi:hypothetical protein
LALLPPPAARPIPKTTLSVRIENSMRELLDCYCEFAGCGRQHVVHEALRFTFQQDGEFQRWLEIRGKTRIDAEWNGS